MAYRTKTYIAGDWDSDEDAVKKLHDWNNSKYWSLSFVDSHNLTEAKDSSLNCSIKRSLREKMTVSKRFVLIVGDSTNSVRAGGCQLCKSYNSHTKPCAREYDIDCRSYIEYECELAVRSGIKIIVLYKSASVNDCTQHIVIV